MRIKEKLYGNYNKIPNEAKREIIGNYLKIPNEDKKDVSW